MSSFFKFSRIREAINELGERIQDAFAQEPVQKNSSTGKKTAKGRRAKKDPKIWARVVSDPKNKGLAVWIEKLGADPVQDMQKEGKKPKEVPKTAPGQPMTAVQLLNLKAEQRGAGGGGDDGAAAGAAAPRSPRRGGRDPLGDRPAMLALALAYAGGVEDLGRAALVSRRWYRAVSTDRALWKWCVRWGSLGPAARPGFWEHCTGTAAREVPDRTEYRGLIKGGQKGGFTEQVLTDVGRTFGGGCLAREPEGGGGGGDEARGGGGGGRAAGGAGGGGGGGARGGAPLTYAELVASSVPAGQREGDGQRRHRHRGGKVGAGRCAPAPAALARGAAPPGLGPAARARFERKRNMQRRLTNVLLATATRHPDVGYCQGMNFVAAALLNAHAEQKAFSEDPQDPGDLARERRALALFHRLLEKYGLLDMYKPGLAALRQRCWQLGELLRLYLPAVCLHLEGQGIDTEMFTVGWFQTIFMYMDEMPFATIRRIWDIYFFERSWKIIFRVAIALLKLVEEDLLALPLDGALRLLGERYPGGRLAPEVLLPTALSYKVTRKHILFLKARYQEKLKQEAAAKQKR